MNTEKMTPSVFLISKSTFQRYLPSGVAMSGNIGKIFSPDMSVNILSHDSKFSESSNILIVRNQGDLEKLKNDLFTKPTLLHVICGKHVPHGQRLNSRGEALGPRDFEWWIMSDNTPWNNPYAAWGDGTHSIYQEKYLCVEFVVSISKQTIREYVERGIEQARNFLRNNKKFSIEVDFNPMIRQWWKCQGPGENWKYCMDIVATVGAKIIITNDKPVNHAFDCGVLWAICSPCYCVSALPYKVWRNYVNQINDVTVCVDGTVAVAHPQSPGYQLDDFQAMISNVTQQPPPWSQTGFFQEPFAFSRGLFPETRMRTQ